MRIKKGFVIYGLLMLAISIFSFSLNIKEKKDHSLETIGIIVGYEESESYDVDSAKTVYLYAPIVEYEVGDNKVTSTLKESSSKKKYDIGYEVKVNYNSKDNNDFIIEGYHFFKDISLFAAIFGLIMFLIGVMFKGS